MSRTKRLTEIEKMQIVREAAEGYAGMVLAGRRGMTLVFVDRVEVTNADYAAFLATDAAREHSHCHPDEGPDKDHPPAKATAAELTIGAIADPFARELFSARNRGDPFVASLAGDDEAGVEHVAPLFDAIEGGGDEERQENADHDEGSRLFIEKNLQ